MKTNINTDNYEAYLLDYIEGNLSPEGAAQLKAFVATQGLNWEELTEELPHLEAPNIVYEGKEKLKKKSAIVPLYVKIASAAAAAGLLLTISLWPEKSLPKVEPVAELNPILPGRLITANEAMVLPPRTIQFIQPKTVAKEKSVTPKRVETPLLAQLDTKKPQPLSAQPVFDEPDFELLAYKMNADLAFAPYTQSDFWDYAEDEQNLSFIGKGLLWLTNGRHDSFASLISSGVRKAKQDLTEVATDMALTAYHRAENSFEETKERWEEKRGE